MGLFPDRSRFIEDMSKTRTVLGKGLSALLPTATAEDRPTSGIELADVVPELERRTPRAAQAVIRGIEIARIAPNPLQPRKDFPAESLAELTASIREHGVVQAVTVRLTVIPAFVIEVESDRKLLELAIVENVQRLQLNPIDEAEGYQRLIEDCGLTQDEVAEKIAKDRTTVANFLRLIRLPEPIKDSLRKGELGLGHAKAVLSAAPAAQVKLWKDAVDHGYSVRKLEALARTTSKRAVETSGKRRTTAADARSTAPAAETVTGETSSELRDMESALQHRLGTQVRVRLKPDNTGEVAIQFYSFDDLDRVRELLSTIHPS